MVSTKDANYFQLLELGSQTIRFGLIFITLGIECGSTFASYFHECWTKIWYDTTCECWTCAIADALRVVSEVNLPYVTVK